MPDGGPSSTVPASAFICSVPTQFGDVAADPSVHRQSRCSLVTIGITGDPVPLPGDSADPRSGSPRSSLAPARRHWGSGRVWQRARGISQLTASWTARVQARTHALPSREEERIRVPVRGASDDGP
jgi:hypothetical protein